MPDPAHSPEYVRTVLAAVEGFLAALDDFMELHVVNTEFARGIAEAVWARDDADEAEVKRRSAALARAAGRAAEATALTNSYINVAGIGRVDPIANWHSMTQPKPVLELADITAACEQMIGRLEGLIAKAEAERVPSLQPDSFHPLIAGAAAALWRDGHRRQAVANAAEVLATHLKSRLGRNDAPETSLWQQAFSEEPPAAGKPRLRWPGPDDDRTVKSMRAGLRQFAPGVQMTVRNSATHAADDLDPQAALERLAALSLLARWVDDCGVVQHPDDIAEGSGQP